jgi:hypothetical protein
VVIPVVHIPGYDVGVDYHAYGANFDQTAFVTIYNQPQVRQAVQNQLQGMADRGATFVHTSIWPVTTPGTTNFGETWRATFPVTDQEAANLRAYAQDVAAVQGVGGNRLRLDIALLWLGAWSPPRSLPLEQFFPSGPLRVFQVANLQPTRLTFQIRIGLPLRHDEAA